MHSITETTQEQVEEIHETPSRPRSAVKTSSPGFTLFGIGSSIAKMLPSWASSSQRRSLPPVPAEQPSISLPPAIDPSVGDETCSICFNSFSEGAVQLQSGKELMEAYPYIVCTPELEEIPFIPDKLKLETCGHTFCPRCIFVWARRKRECPLCKQKFVGFKFAESTNKLEFCARIGVGHIGISGPGSQTSGTITTFGDVGGVRTRRATTMNQEGANRGINGTRSQERGPSPSDSRDICYVCTKGDSPSLLLVCDGCDYRTAHTYCLDMGRTIPRGQWYCRWCEMDGTAQIKRDEHAARKLERARALQILQRDAENLANGTANTVRRPKRNKRRLTLNISRRKRDPRRRGATSSTNQNLNSSEIDDDEDGDQTEHLKDTSGENTQTEGLIGLEELQTTNGFASDEMDEKTGPLAEKVPNFLKTRGRPAGEPKSRSRIPKKPSELQITPETEAKDHLITIRQFRAENRSRKLLNLSPLETPEHLKPIKPKPKTSSAEITTEQSNHPSSESSKWGPPEVHGEEEPSAYETEQIGYLESQMDLPDRESAELNENRHGAGLAEFKFTVTDKNEPAESELTNSIYSGVSESKCRQKGYATTSSHTSLKISSTSGTNRKAQFTDLNCTTEQNQKRSTKSSSHQSHGKTFDKVVVGLSDILGLAKRDSTSDKLSATSKILPEEISDPIPQEKEQKTISTIPAGISKDPKTRGNIPLPETQQLFDLQPQPKPEYPDTCLPAATQLPSPTTQTLIQAESSQLIPSNPTSCGQPDQTVQLSAPTDTQAQSLARSTRPVLPTPEQEPTSQHQQAQVEQPQTNDKPQRRPLQPKRRIFPVDEDDDEAPPRLRELFCSPEESRDKLHKRVRVLPVVDCVGPESDVPVLVHDRRSVLPAYSGTLSDDRLPESLSWSRCFLRGEDLSEGETQDDEQGALGKRSLRISKPRSVKHREGKQSIRSCPEAKRCSEDATKLLPDNKQEKDNYLKALNTIFPDQLRPGSLHQFTNPKFSENHSTSQTKVGLTGSDRNRVPARKMKLLIGVEEFFDTDEDLSRCSLSRGDTVQLDPAESAETIFFTCLEIESAELEALKKDRIPSIDPHRVVDLQ